MENAILEIRKSNKGKLVGSIKFENGKSMPIPSKFQFTEEGINECRVMAIEVGDCCFASHSSIFELISWTILAPSFYSAC